VHADKSAFAAAVKKGKKRGSTEGAEASPHKVKQPKLEKMVAKKDAADGPEASPQKVSQPKLEKMVSRNEPDGFGVGAARSPTKKLPGEEVPKILRNLTELAGEPSHFIAEDGKFVLENSAFNNKTKKSGYLRFFSSRTGPIRGFQFASKVSGVLLAEFDLGSGQAKFRPVLSRRELSTYKDDTEQAALAAFLTTAADRSSCTRNRLSILFVGDTALKASSSLQPTLRRFFEDRDFKVPFGEYRQPAIVVLFNGSVAACVGEPAKTLHMRCSACLDKASIEAYSEPH